jgi:hypothetical protein
MVRRIAHVIESAGWRVVGRAASVLACLLVVPGLGFGQSTEFQIEWTVVGQAAGADAVRPVRAGKALFTTADISTLSLQNVRVARVDVQPVVLQVATGQQVCVPTLKIQAFDADGRTVGNAPLSIAVRRDHEKALELTRSKENVCVRPSAAGEYPLRFSSLLPAPDGTMRGAQAFMRVQDRQSSSRKRTNP